MSLFRNFISLSDVVGVVANCIAVEDIDLDSGAHGVGSEDVAAAFENRFEIASKRRLHQTSELLKVWCSHREYRERPTPALV